MAREKSKTPRKKAAKRALPKRSGAKAKTAGKRAGLDISVSPDFRAWLVGAGVSLAFTTGATSKLFLIGPGAAGEDVAVAERTIENCQGVAAAGHSLYVSSKWQIWRFENACPPGRQVEGYDAVYVPKASHVTGDIDCREMAVDADGRLVFVNPLFNCLAYLSRDYSFHPVWRPPFVSAYVAEDRCHLTGLALADGRPAFVTAAAETDGKDAWRDRKTGGGVVIDVRTGAVVCAGLSMPHSPRLIGRTLWLQNAGTGFLGKVNPEKRTFEPVAFCPGYLRGMAIVGNFAVCAVSKPRPGEGFGDLTLEENLKAAGTEARCGLVVVDLAAGAIRHWLRIEGVVEEIHGVAAISGVQRPRAVGFKSDEIGRIISLPPELA